jgi:hypothetical protein
MTSLRTLIVIIGMTGLAGLALAQTAVKAAPAKVSPADAKSHLGETATVCGKVVDAQIKDPGMAGRGKPIFYDLDQPQPHPVFYFVAFGPKPGGFPEANKAVAAHKDKQVCVTGKITAGTDDAAFIFAADPAQVKLQK